MRLNLSSHIRGFILSFISSLGIVVLAGLASLLGYNSNSLADSFATLVVFFAVPSTLGALISSAVSMGLFALGSRKGRALTGLTTSFVGSALLAVFFALFTQQIPDYDVTLLLIIGCCAGSLAGPASYIVASGPRSELNKSVDEYAS